MLYKTLRYFLFGNIFYLSEMFQLASLLSTLIWSGIGLTENLRLCEKTIKNRYIRSKFRSARALVNEGKSLPDALRKYKLMPLMQLDILEVGALQGDEWGFTGIFAKENGGGFLTDHFPKAAKAIWDLNGIYTSSRHIPGVKFAGITHPGLIGCAPSHELLREWNRRETELVNTAPDRRTYGAGLSGSEPVLAALPNPNSAILGNVAASDFDRIANEAARTVPPREHGGNCDIKNLTKGTRIYFPVYVEGGKLSMGDIHFSQGDGEISFCGAIEMSGYLDLHVDIIKGGMAKYGMVNPMFKTSPVEPHYSDYLVFEGISVDEFEGKQHYMDVHIAYRRACLNAIEYLKKFGYTGEQAYLLLSCAPVEGRISGIVDIPNACCTLALPTSIFDQDILPC